MPETGAAAANEKITTACKAGSKLKSTNLAWQKEINKAAAAGRNANSAKFRPLLQRELDDFHAKAETAIEASATWAENAGQ